MIIVSKNERGIKMAIYNYKDLISFKRDSSSDLLLPIGEYRALTLYHSVSISPNSSFKDVIFDCYFDYIVDCDFVNCVFLKDFFDSNSSKHRSYCFINCNFKNCDFSNSPNIRMAQDCCFDYCIFSNISPIEVDNSCKFTNCCIGAYPIKLKCIFNTGYYDIGVLLFENDDIQYYYSGELIGDSIEFKEFILETFQWTDSSIEFSRFQDILNSLINKKVKSIQ